MIQAEFHVNSTPLLHRMSKFNYSFSTFWNHYACNSYIDRWKKFFRKPQIEAVTVKPSHKFFYFPILREPEFQMSLYGKKRLHLSKQIRPPDKIKGKISICGVCFVDWMTISCCLNGKVSLQLGHYLILALRSSGKKMYVVLEKGKVLELWLISVFLEACVLPFILFSDFNYVFVSLTEFAFFPPLSNELCWRLRCRKKYLFHP